MQAEYGQGVYNRGLIAHTTIDSHMQSVAENTLSAQLIKYDRRHGYRGPEFRQLLGTADYIAAPEYGYPANWIETLANTRDVGTQLPAIVTRVDETDIDVLTREATDNQDQLGRSQVGPALY